MLRPAMYCTVVSRAPAKYAKINTYYAKHLIWSLKYIRQHINVGFPAPLIMQYPICRRLND